MSWRRVLQWCGLVVLCLSVPSVVCSQVAIKSLTLAQQDDLVYVAQKALSGDGISSSTGWTGWEITLATNQVLVGNVPTGCTNNVCQWNPGVSYYFQAGTYILTYPVVITGGKTKLIGNGKGLTSIRYDPTTDGTVAFTLGQAGTSGGAFFLEVSKLAIFSSATNRHTKTALFIIDGEQVRISDNQIFNWHGPNSVGLHIQGREFYFVENNNFNADTPLFIEGGPGPVAGLNNLGVSRFTGNLYFGCTSVNNPCLSYGGNASPSALISIAGSTYLSDVQFIGSSMIGGTTGFVWVGTPATRSERVLIEDIRWEQMSDEQHQANGWFINIYLVGGSDLVGLTVRNAGYAPAVTPIVGNGLGGLQLGNVHQVIIDTVTNIGAQSGPYLSLTNAYPVTVQNSFATPGNSPVLNGGICYTYKSPQSTAFIGGFQNALPSGGLNIIDLPVDNTKCVP